METEIALMAAGYGLARLGLLALVAYAVYRALTATPNRVPVRAQARYTEERLQATRNHQRYRRRICWYTALYE